MIWGMYTDIEWQPTGGYKRGDGNTFIFKFDNETQQVTKFKIKEGADEVYHSSNTVFSTSGPCAVFDEKAQTSFAALYNSCDIPEGTDDCYVLAGDPIPKLSEIEIYLIE